ncbi:hypothetical protein BaRGS_00011900 [Batillaria attramentaria]|uniref:Uncharacterized protein n=1 Tax=Batillaria attramentaria TaxID=370345 RepID=A0ABD0LC27_9CAEN
MQSLHCRPQDVDSIEALVDILRILASLRPGTIASIPVDRFGIRYCRVRFPAGHKTIIVGDSLWTIIPVPANRRTNSPANSLWQTFC